ncbi:hypothetical protein EVAR_41648_1 [Eumeta japonica]|uniref:Uncharacterized protein n=1 Tax=Eumeta variegata TaxID=151549 RepID=A0A4C1X3F6_EUMVA|nr:hypothetical protein EVAR_41648_1 [Eumeta japonica]
MQSKVFPEKKNKNTCKFAQLAELLPTRPTNENQTVFKSCGIKQERAPAPAAPPAQTARSPLTLHNNTLSAFVKRLHVHATSVTY